MKLRLLFWIICISPFFLSAQITLDSTILDLRVLATGLDVPWDMVYGPDDRVWFTELEGRISKLNHETGEVQEVYTIPDVEVFGFSAGLHALALDPEFLSNQFLYVHYTNSTSNSKLVRYTYDGISNTLIEPTVLLDNIVAGPSHNGSRLATDNQHLYLCLGDAYFDPSTAQDMANYNGKILRLMLDGSIPADNPIENSYIWSWGHRNPQGMVLHGGKIYSSEHGTSADDEVNLIEVNRNYGWPTVEGFCDLPAEVDFCATENAVEPLWAFSPSIAPCGIDYYGSAAIPEWENSLLLTSLKDQKLTQLQLNESGETILSATDYLVQEYGRLRDVITLPDGRILICTSNRDFAGNPGVEDDLIIELKARGTTTASQVLKPQPRITLFPNPVQDILHVQLEDVATGGINWEIRDIQGRKVMEMHELSFSFHVALSQLEAGSYTLHLGNGEWSKIRRFIVVK